MTIHRNNQDLTEEREMDIYTVNLSKKLLVSIILLGMVAFILPVIQNTWYEIPYAIVVISFICYIHSLDLRSIDNAPLPYTSI